MAYRNILQEGDPLLTRRCRPVEQYDERLFQLLDDMVETMNRAGGVGLAAPQVGVLRRVCVIDVGDGPLELINPVIVAQSGRQETAEGCLSSPGRCGITRRPKKVTVTFFNRRGEPVKMTGVDLLAKAFCHEIVRKKVEKEFAAVRLVFMGTPDFALPPLRALAAAGHTIAGVFCQPDRPAGRGHRLLPPPVKVLAEEMGLPVFQPVSLKTGEATAQLRSLAPECVVVVAYGKLLPEEMLALPPLGCVNIHASLLPRYRGAAPIQWAVLRGETETGVTTMLMDKGMDTGALLLQKRCPILPNETAGQLFERLAEMGGELIGPTLEGLRQGTITPTPQRGEEATYAPPLTRADSPMDFTRPAHALAAQVRGLNPWPSATVSLAGQTLKVHEAEVVGECGGQPGEVTAPRQLIVCCGDGRALRLKSVQPAGARPMSDEAYLRGHPLPPGSRVEPLTGQ